MRDDESVELEQQEHKRKGEQGKLKFFADLNEKKVTTIIGKWASDLFSEIK